MRDSIPAPVISPVSLLLSWAHRRRVLVALAAVCLAALSMLGATRLTFDTDVLSLLPRTGQVIPAFRTFVEHFGSLDELYVVFTAPEGHAISDYRDDVEDWIARLRTTEQIARVDAGLADPSRKLDWLADRQLLLLRTETLHSALRPFSRRRDAHGRCQPARAPRAAIAVDRRVVRQDPLGALRPARRAAR